MPKILTNGSGTYLVTIPKSLIRKHKIREGTEIIWSECKGGLKFRRL